MLLADSGRRAIELLRVTVVEVIVLDYANARNERGGDCKKNPKILARVSDHLVVWLFDRSGSSLRLDKYLGIKGRRSGSLDQGSAGANRKSRDRRQNERRCSEPGPCHMNPSKRIRLDSEFGRA